MQTYIEDSQHKRLKHKMYAVILSFLSSIFKLNCYNILLKQMQFEIVCYLL